MTGNLLAVDGRSNAQKGDGDTATWLPSNKTFRCDYVARQVSVKATYGLWVTQAEHEDIFQSATINSDSTEINRVSAGVSTRPCIGRQL